MEKEYLTFIIGESTLSIDVNKVIAVIKKDAITKLPLTKAFVLGVVNYNSNPIPIIDGQYFLNYQNKNKNRKNQDSLINTNSYKNILIINTGQGEGIGIAINSVIEISNNKKNIINNLEKFFNQNFLLNPIVK